MSRGQSQPRNQPIRRALERCKAGDTVEIIDVDKEKVDVVIVDVEETCYQRSRVSGTSRRNSYPTGVISIDDEDGDDRGTFRNSHTDITSKEFCPASSNSSISEESKSDECLMTTGKIDSLPKTREYTSQYHDVGTSINHFGLGFSSESDSGEFFSSGSMSSDSDSSDCEIIEDSSGNIREQWERAASRKKMSARQQRGSDQASPSGSGGSTGVSPEEEAYSNIDVENCIKKVCSEYSNEVPAGFCPNHSSCAMGNLFFSMPPAAEGGDSFCRYNMNTTDIDVDAAINIGDRQAEVAFETCSQRTQATCENPFNNLRPGFQDPEVVLCDSICHLNMQHQPNSEGGYVSSFEKEASVSVETTFCADGLHGETTFVGEGEAPPIKSYPGNTQPGDGEKLSMFDTIILDNMEHIPMEPVQPQCDSGTSPRTVGFQEKVKTSLDELSSSNYHHSDGPLLNVDDKTTTQEPSVSDANEESGTIGTTGKTGVCSSDKATEVLTQVHTDLICERERHKESDEYRRAIQEEWAARQLQLQIQAEEAQRLKRKRRAETLRLLDTERRQKQRLEEIRESQKKDEETINLKEQLRAEIRKELDKMELQYRDMASLLRGLGIHVKGGSFPMPHEVNAAYKQALLRFHPDRASRSDIRQQVMAEETFKLISRLKGKLLPVM